MLLAHTRSSRFDAANHAMQFSNVVVRLATNLSFGTLKSKLSR